MFPPGLTDLVSFSLGHISRYDLLDEMLNAHDEVAVLCAVSNSCKGIERVFTIILGKLFLNIYQTDSNIDHFRVIGETCELFSRDIYAIWTDTHRKFELTSPRFSGIRS